MAKELPYFRFTAQEWQNKDISLESYELKGLFIDICAYYWIKDCSIATALLKKRFRNDIALIDNLLELEIIKTDGDTIQIEFLNEQYDQLSEKRKRRQKAGSLGGFAKAKRSNAKAKLQQCSGYKDKDKDKDKKEERFRSEVAACNGYSESMKKEFCDYWTESSPNGKKLRFEKEKVFSIPRRLTTWDKRTNHGQPKLPTKVLR